MTEFDKEHTKSQNDTIADSPADSMGELPKPSSRRGNIYKLAALALFVAVATAGSLFWMSRDDETKEEVKRIVQDEVAQVIEDTPLEKPVQTVVEYINPPPPPPLSVTNPTTDPGTLAGQEIRTGMSALPSETRTISTTGSSSTHAGDSQDDPMNTETQGTQAQGTGAQDTENANAQDQNGSGSSEASAEIITPLLPKVEEDTVVPLPFVEDVAHWMVGHYVPNKGVSLSLSAVNLRYGQQMHTLMPSGNEGQGDVYTARSELLRYAFNPTMLNALYNLYADRFVESLGNAAATPQKGKALTPAQTNAMYDAYSQVMASLGAVLKSIGNMSDFAQRMQAMDTLSQEALDIHSQLTTAVFDLDTAREKGDDTAQRAAQLRVDGLNATYQRVLADRQTARTQLVNDIYTYDEVARAVDADTVYFVAEWLKRRDDAAKDSSLAAAQLLQDLAGRLRKAGDATQ